VRSIAITLLAVLVSLPAVATAGFQDRASYLSGRAAFAFAWSRNTRQTMSGGGIEAAYERMFGGGEYTVGLSASFATVSENLGTSSNPASVDYYTIPVLVSGRWFLSDESASVVPYAGAGAGLHVSWASAASSSIADTQGRLGLAGKVSLGGAWFVSESLFIDLNYTLLFLTRSPYDNGLANLIQAGIGARVGN
jgi:hypothetical protein